MTVPGEPGIRELHVYRCRVCNFTRGYPSTPREEPICPRCGTLMDFCGGWMVKG